MQAAAAAPATVPAPQRGDGAPVTRRQNIQADTALLFHVLPILRQSVEQRAESQACLEKTWFVSRFRLIIHSIVTYPFFDTFIMIIIILSSIALAAEDPVEETSQRNLVLTYFDYLFTCIFAVEMVLKVGVNHLDIDVHQYSQYSHF